MIGLLMESVLSTRFLLPQALAVTLQVKSGRVSRSAVSSSSMPLLLTSPDRKSTRLNSSHVEISYAVFCLKKKKLIRTLFPKAAEGYVHASRDRGMHQAQQRGQGSHARQKVMRGFIVDSVNRCARTGSA